MCILLDVNNRPTKIQIAESTNWNAVEKRLAEERRSRLPLTDTSEAIKNFRLSWKVAQKAGVNRRETGLVEQQACFATLREQRT